jgi:Endonuclease NucS C-terminal domain
MPAEVRLWNVVGDSLSELQRTRLDLEERLEVWLERDISILSHDLLVVGRQVETAYGGFIDLLCIDRNGDTVIVELKRDKTPREITAQALDYGSWVNELSHETVSVLADRYLSSKGTDLQQSFLARFGSNLPEVLNERHSILILSASIDPSSERIIKYLSSVHRVNINAVTFSYFRTEQSELLARVFLLEPVEVEQRSLRSGESKRQPNLTPDELVDASIRAGVDHLYRALERKLSEVLYRRTTRSSLAFYGRFGGGYKAVFSLLPLDSSESSGLRFILYLHRLAEFLGVSADKVQASVPQSHEPWKYYPSADQDASGLAGYFREQQDVERFLELFQSSSQGGSTANPSLNRTDTALPRGSAG